LFVVNPFLTQLNKHILTQLFKGYVFIEYGKKGGKYILIRKMIFFLLKISKKIVFVLLKKSIKKVIY